MAALLSVESLAHVKGLPVEYLRSLEIADLPGDGVTIPYFAEDGEEMFSRQRHAATPRFRQPAGVGLAAYGLWKLDLARRAGYLALVEGESDCWALWFHEEPALGLPGAGCAQALLSDSVEHLERVYIHVEPDQGGQQFLAGCLKRLREIAYRGSIFEVSTPGGGKDPADLHAADPERFLERWRQALLEANLVRLPSPGTNGHARNGSPPAAPEKPASVPVLVQLSTVPREPVRWLMDGWLPDGTLSVLDGDPGLGKSTLTLDLAARISRGWAMPPAPGGERVREPAGVLLLGAEDSLKNTVGPRLDAAGADSQRIHYFDCVRQGESERDPMLPYDLDMLADWLEENAVRLIVVDPLVAFVGGEYDAHKDQDIRRCLRSLRNFSEKHGIAMLLLRHLNKLNGGASLYRGGGSIGISGAARASLIVGRDPADDGRKVLAMNKINLAAFPRSLAYRIEPTPEGASRIAWLGETDLQAHEILWHHTAATGGRTPGRPADQLSAAKDFLRLMLSNDAPLPVAQLRAEADAEGISWGSLKRAKQDLGARTLKLNGEWHWSLEGEDEQPFS